MRKVTVVFAMLGLLAFGCSQESERIDPATPDRIAFDLYKDLQPEASPPAEDQMPADAMNSSNNPSNLGLAFRRRISELPLSGESVKKPWPAYWWPYSAGGVGRRWLSGQYSPIEKYAQLTKQGGAPYSWEYWNHGPGTRPGSWWGHCNGWSSYTLNEFEPRRPVMVRLTSATTVEPCSGGAGCIRFEVGDINGLMTELYFHDAFRLVSGRCNRSNPAIDRYGRVWYPECRDSNPGTMHIVVTNMLGLYRRMVIADTTYDWQVWNFPAYRFEVSQLREISASEANSLIGVASSSYAFNSAASRFFQVTLRLWLVEDSIGPRTTPAGHLLPYYTTIETYTYVLETASDGTILGGEYTGSSKRDHPDFLWYSFRNSFSGTDDDLGDADNRYVRYSIVKQMLKMSQ